MFHFSSFDSTGSAAHFCGTSETGGNYSVFCNVTRPLVFNYSSTNPVTAATEHTYTNIKNLSNLIARVDGTEEYNSPVAASDMGTAPLIGSTRRAGVSDGWGVLDGRIGSATSGSGGLLVYNTELTGTDLTDAELFVKDTSTF